MQTLIYFFGLFFSLFLVGCTGAAYQLPKASKAEIAEVDALVNSNEFEIKIFERSDQEYEKRISRIAKNLQENASPLCLQSQYPSCYFDVKYDNADIVNAYAHDNNRITVYKGMLKFLANDDEMAALVGHEMGHHLAKHNEETLHNAQTGAAVSGILTAVVLAAANANNPYYNSYQQQQDQQTMENMMMVGAKIGQISYSKEQEREADLLGAYLVTNAGYDLEKAQNLLYVMAKISGEDVPGKAALLDTHPPSNERVVAWGKVINDIEVTNRKIPYLKK